MFYMVIISEKLNNDLHFMQNYNFEKMKFEFPAKNPISNYLEHISDMYDGQIACNF